MKKRRGGFDLIFNHNCLDIFQTIYNEEGFEYVKSYLVKKYPELEQLDVNSDKEWLEQVAEILQIDYDKLVKEIEKQILRSYYINETYNKLVTIVNDPKVSIIEKEKLTKLPLRLIIAQRQLKAFLFGLWRSLQVTLISALVCGLVTLVFWFIWPIGFAAVLFGICTFFVSGLWYFPKMHNKICDEIFSKLLRR